MPLLQRSAIVTAMFTALALPAIAQTGTAATTPSTSQGQTAQGHKQERHNPQAREGRMEQRMQALKASLKLNANQQAAWNDYSTAIKPQHPPTGERPQHLDRNALASMTTPQRIDAMQAQHSQRQAAMQAAMERRNQATKAFYAALSPEQQKTFDAETLKMHERRGKGKNHGKGHGSGNQGPHAQQTAPASNS